MKFSSVLSIILLLHACFFLPSIHGKRSFGVSRRTKTQKSYSARRGDGRNSQPDSHHEPIPKPAPPPKSISKTDTHAPSAPAQPGWNNHGGQHPAGPPPAYPGMAHNPAPAHGMPPAYPNPPAYSPYGQQPGPAYGAPGGGMSPYGGYQQPPMGGMGYQQPGMMGGMGYQQPMGIMNAPPQRATGGGLSVGSVLTGMAVGGVATHLVGSMIPRRQVTEQHIHHYEHSDKEDAGAAPAPQLPQEGLAPLVTPEPVLLANPDQPNQFNQQAPEPEQPMPMEPIYNFNYAPAYVQPVDVDPTTGQIAETSPEQTPTEDTPETTAS